MLLPMVGEFALLSHTWSQSHGHLQSYLQTCCSDGIRNQGEEGVDCGGPCEPCKIPTDCKWGDWELGECSKTCGGGWRTNYRKVLVHESNGGKACTGKTWKTEDCNTQSCLKKGTCTNYQTGKECWYECDKTQGPCNF